MSESMPPPNMPPPSGDEPAPMGDPAPSFTPAAAPARGPAARRPPGRLLGLGLAVVVIVVIALVAFSSSSNNTVDPLASAATTSTNAPGYRMLLSMNISSPALPGAITGSGGGSFSTKAHTGTMSLTMHVPTASSGTSSLVIKEILDGATVYLQLPPAEMSTLGTVGKQWIAVNLAKLSGIPQLASIESNPASSNPGELLDYLKAASGGVTDLGSATVDGFKTTRYHAKLELSQIPNALPAADRAAAEAALSKLQTEAHVSAFPVDVWIDPHHLVRRIELSINASADGQTIDEGFTIDIPEYGPQPPPTIPPASEVASASSLTTGG